MNTTKAAKTLICIPDISGFTKFMSETNFDLGSKVIPSLLNNIIYSNEIDLKISEIEGDAVLFYKTGELPPLLYLVDQCRHFYLEFYKQLHQLKARYNKTNGAENIPKILGLKIILHYGKEVGQVSVGKNIKLIGEDVITAHLLLKNEIPLKEYILLSDGLLSQYSEEEKLEKLDWAEIKRGAIEEKHLGKIPFTFINLKPLSY